MSVLGWVRVTYPGGRRRVYSLIDYCLLPSAALLGTYAAWISRREAVRLLAEEGA